MNKKIISLFFYAFIALLFSSQNVSLTKEQKKLFTNEEIEYINEHPIVSIAMIKDYMPFSYLKNEELTGFSVDLIKLISKKTGLKFNLVPDSWSNNIYKFKNGKIELIDCISYKKERTPFTLYTEPYYEIPILIFGKNDFGNYEDLKDLRGKKVGVWKDIFYESYLKKIKEIQIVEGNNIEELMQNLAYGKIDAVITTLQQGNFFIKKDALINIKILGKFNLSGIKNDDLRIGTNIDKPILNSIINKGLNSITPDEMEKLKNIWFGVQTYNKDFKVKFSSKEQKYLDNCASIKMCICDNWLPFEGIDSKGHSIGMIADYFEIFKKRIGKNIILIPTKSWNESFENAKQKKCDIIAATNKNPKMSKYLKFTSPYIKFPVVMATNRNVQFVENIEQVSDKKIGAVAGYFTAEYLKNNYPEIKLIEVKNTVDGLKRVASGELFGFIGSLATIGYQMQAEDIVQLKISGKLDLQSELCVAVRRDEPILFDIFQKAIESITEEDKQKIRNKWIAVKYGHGLDYSLFWKILSVIGLILVIIIYWNQKLRKEVEQRKIAEIKLKKTNQDLKIKSEALKIAKIEAEEANRAKSEFLANINHELRTPLNAVIGFSELLSTLITGTKERKYLEAIKISGESLLSLINDILDLSKIEARKLKLEFKKFNLKNLFFEMKQIFMITLEKKGIDFFVEIEKGIPEIVISDKLKLRQIFMNLIGNAVKFTEKGYIRITVEKTFLSEVDNKMNLMIKIKDTGIGIKEESINKIFEAFVQQNGQDTRKYGGTGLGLTISKELVRMLDGEISVESEEGEGTTFTINFRNVKFVNDEPSKHKKLLENKNKDKDKGKNHKLKILVVDDVDSNRELLKKTLEFLGMRVITCVNGEIALEIVQKNNIDLIFMDIRMPVMGGIEAMEKLKSNPNTKNIPVVAITALSPMQNKDFLLEKGFDEYLAKPFKISEVEDILALFSQHKNKSNENVTKDRYKLYFEKIVEPEKLISKLEKEVTEQCQNLRKVMIIGKIKNLGLELQKISEIHNIAALKEIGENIVTYSDLFDTDALEEQLDELMDLIKNLKTLRENK